MLLLSTYGLRACEVAGLTLDDIDWRNKRFRTRERKAGNTTTYPLLAAFKACYLTGSTWPRISPLGFFAV